MFGNYFLNLLWFFPLIVLLEKGLKLFLQNLLLTTLAANINLQFKVLQEEKNGQSNISNREFSRQSFKLED